MASGAGLNRVSAVILAATPSTTAVAAPTSAYGTIGVNDSGVQLVEARDFTKWSFSLLGGGTGYSISLYGTSDPLAYAQWMAAHNPGLYAQRVGGQPTVPASSWQLLPAPADETGTGPVGNPLTAAAPYLQFSGALVAVRAVVTTVSTPVGSVSVAVEVAP